MQKQKKFKHTYEWKEKDEKYLLELQKFFDKVDNIKDSELKESIITQMLKCDKVLTELAQKMISRS